MRRVRHSAPRVRNRLFFPILFFVGLDFGLLGLALVVYLTPLHPNYPVSTGPILTPRPPQISAPAVVLPVGNTTPYSAPVSPRRTAPAHRYTPSAPRPSASRSTAPTPSVVKSPPPTSTPQPTDTATTPTPTESDS